MSERCERTSVRTSEWLSTQRVDFKDNLTHCAPSCPPPPDPLSLSFLAYSSYADHVLCNELRCEMIAKIGSLEKSVIDADDLIRAHSAPSCFVYAAINSVMFARFIISVGFSERLGD